MKICYISNTYFTDSDLGIMDSLGAGHKVCYAVMLPLRNTNFSEAQLQQLAEEKGVELKMAVSKRRQRSPMNIRDYSLWLRSLQISRFDVVYINNTEDFILSALLLLYTNGKKMIYGVHDAISHSGWKTNFLMKAANRMLQKRADALLAFSELQAGVLKKRTPCKTVFNIPMAVKDFGAAEAKVTRQEQVSFLFFGNIAPYKGLDLLLQSVKELSGRYSNFNLVIAGRCQEWQAVYEELIDENMPVERNIRFIDNSEIAGFFSKADYLVLPYRDVTQSGPLMIAYNYSLPVLASQLEGFNEFIEEGKTGYFFKPGNVESLTRVMELAILRKKESYQLLRDNISRYARQKFSAPVITARYNEMFEKVILKKGA